MQNYRTTICRCRVSGSENEVSGDNNIFENVVNFVFLTGEIENERNFVFVFRLVGASFFL